MTVDLTIKNCKLWIDNKLVNYGLAMDEGVINSISKDVNLPESDEKIDCKGNIILPGFIDAHVHFREPGMTWKEDWVTGSNAAAKGGITFVIDMPNTIPSTTTIETLRSKLHIAEEKSCVNFGLYVGITEENLDQIKQLANHAHAFKIYMAETTGELKLSGYDLLIDAFSKISKTNKLVSVHAEEQKIIDELKEKYKDSDDPISYTLSRPPEAEITAIKEVITLAKKTGVKLHICHLTTKEGLDLIRKAKSEKINVTCETCPHYLFLTIEAMKEIGTFAKVNPPLRTKQDQDALWEGILDGTIDMIVSDHAPHTFEEKSQDIWNAPSGIPGVESTLQLMLNVVNKKILSLERLIQLMHDNPALRFGLDNYGRIETGVNANLTIIDLKKEWKIKRDDLVTKCGWSPYEDWEGKGIPVMTIVDGQIVFNQF